MIITVPFFAIAFLLLGMHQSSPTEYQSDWSPSPTGYLRRTGTQSDWVPQKDWDPVGLGTSEGLGPSPPVMTGTGASLPPVSLRREYF